MTEEETKEIVPADVKRQLAPTHSDPTEKIDPVKARRLLKNLQNHRRLCCYQTMTALL
jgi:hypothetical protein